MKDPEPRTPRSWLHRVCAHPYIISWAIGSIGLWIPLTIQFHAAGVFGYLTMEWSTIPLVLLCYAATSGLGFFVGGFSIVGLVLAACRRLNGAPHEVGECVTVLSGPHAGKVSTIYEIAKGQGGQPVPRVDLGEEAKHKNQDMFDEYSLLRISSRPAACPEAALSCPADPK